MVAEYIDSDGAYLNGQVGRQRGRDCADIVNAIDRALAVPHEVNRKLLYLA